uniref:Si:ch73-347e22.4 n=1 Tax=Sinocyclocheilus rhinocerous TaxID=307959 RepID=A0A673G1H2_9TELE
MDGELPPWNKHGSHNSRTPYNTAGERQEGHDDMIGDSFAAGEQMTSLSSCMSGAFKALLPDHHGTSSAMSANSDKYSYSSDNHCLIKPGIAVDKKSAVESDFLKDPLGEASASVTHMLPLRCAQYVRHEKNRELDQGNGNWTSVIKDALEMSNGMEMEQTLSMDECGPLMDYNLIYKGPETEANFRLKGHFNLQIAGSKLNEKQDGQGVKEEPDSFISMLSDDISKNKDVLEMVGEASILDVGSSLGKEELGITGIREHELGLLPGFTRSSYTPFSSSESLTKSEQFSGIPLDNQSVGHTLQVTRQRGLSCKDVSPRKTASTNTGFKHAKVNNETVPESSTVYGLHHLDLQKGCHQAEITDGKTSVNSQDHSSQHNVQDERVKTSKPHVSESTVIKQSAAYLPNTQYFGSKLKKQFHDLVPTPTSVGSQNTAVVKCENVELRIPTEERISESSLSVPGKNETNDFQETSISTKNAKLSLKVETKFAPEIQNSSSGSETVPNLPVLPNIIHTDYKCKDSQTEPSESGKLNELCFQENNSKNIHIQQKQTQTSVSTVLLHFNENFKNSDRSEKVFLNINSESSIPPSTENVQEAPPSPTSRTDCSSQHNLQKASQRHKKARKRKKSELEALSGPIHKANKRDNCSVYGSEILESVDKLDTARYEEANQNVSLADNDSTAPKEEDLITNGDVNPPAPRKKCRMAQLELVADTAETPQKPDHSCSEASQEEVPSNSRINRKAISRKKLKKKTRLKAKNSATLSLSQSTILSPEEDCTSHFQVSDTTPMKGVSNPTVTQHAISSLESNVPTFSEPKEDLVDVKRHQKMRRFPIKASKGKNMNATSFLNRQSSLEPQTDSVSTSVTESSNIVCRQNSPNKSKQKKRAYIHKAAKTPNVCPQEDMENVMTSKTKIVKAKRPLKKAARKDNNETTLLDTQSSIATVKQTDSVSNVGNEVESPVILSTPRKSQKKKLSDMCVLNPLSETDVSIVQPTTKRFRTQKTLDKKVSHNTVGENCEPAHLALSSVDSVYATETDYSGISQQIHTPAVDQTMQHEIHAFDSASATEMGNSDVLKQKKTKVKRKRQSKKPTKCKTHITQAISDIREQSTVQQENSVSNRRTNSRSEDMTMECMKKRTSALNVRNDQPEDHVEHSTVLSPLLPPPISQSKDATQDSCKKTDTVNETAESHVENQVSITTEDVASPQSSLKAKNKQRKQLLEQKEENEQSNILELAHREDKMSDVPSVVREVATENFETDRSQQSEKDGTVVDQKDLKATKNTKKKGRKAGRKKKKVACLLTQTIEKEEHKDICYDNRIVSDFQNNTQIQISEISQRITNIPEEPVLKSRKSTRTQKIHSGPVVENLLTQGKSTVSLDITECHTTFGEILSSSMQTADCEGQYTVEKKPPRRGRPPSKKSKKQKLFVAHLEDNTSPSVHISDLTPCQDSTENTVKAAASTVKQKVMDKNVIVTKQLGTDPPESLQSATDLLSHSIPTSGRKKGKNLKRPIRNPKLSSLRVSSRTSETSVKSFQKGDITSLPQNSTKVFNEEGKTSLPMPETVKKQKLCEKTSIKDGNVPADIKIENKATIKVLKGRKRVANNRTIRSKPKEIVKKPLTCKYCGVSFRHITAYTIHRRIHTGDKPYKCKICGKTFAQLSKLKSHRNVHKQDSSFPCPCCSRMFLQKDELLCHFKVHLQESKANSEPHKHVKSKRNISSNVSSETPNNYGCLICKKSFVNHVKLQNHMQVHEVEKPLTCKNCEKTFRKQSSLIAHEKTHWPVKPYACSICGKGFNQLKALKKHSQDHAGETPFSCFHCGHGFSALSALRMHQASKTCIARRNYEASNNTEGFIVSQGVDGQVNTPVFFKCQICKQLFRKWCQYTLHLQTHTSSPPYICFSCGQCYEKDSEMNVHCEVCCQSSGEEKICSASLTEIMQGVTQTYPLKCTSSQSPTSTGFQLDSQTTTSSEQLPQLPQLVDVEPTQTRDTDLSKLPKTYSAHSPIKLPNAQSPTRSDVNCSDVNCTSPSSSLECIEITQSLWKFKCSRCGQRFERYRTLSAHLQTHAPGFIYTCAQCGQFFERWSKLWLHQKHHRLKSRCYSCTQCNLQFRFFSSFREHMIDHAGQRPYACPLCPKTFIQEASLHAHQCESHKLCKSLKCDVCSKTFNSLRNLIKHSLLHNGSTSHVCLLCNLSFTNTRVLKEHLKTHTTYHGPALPDIPSKPLDFPHKCKRCKASFSTGELLYAHQIRHSRDAKTHIRPAVVPTSKLFDSCHNDTPSTPPSTRRNHISNLKLDGIPNDSLYVYSHPDRIYVPPSGRVQLPVINLDPDEPEDVSDSQNPGHELPNSEITSQSDSTHLPQATLDHETTNLNSSESIEMMANGQHNYSRKYQRSPSFVETSVDMEVETPAQEEDSSESFECADCTEKLASVLGLYEHYILHAMGDAYVQVN